ncbi:DUF3500 domain-containing protein [Phytoactinopolyspora alkaliphila]|uniref:DUF3500 domain-containing protein n=1 Tax=Phytoactinopolyspora alkaliphila TaxID=1783498 RepID=A0A6N9YLA1_9ACTN|nr:DUF3500 domain-containing protein [Phytoactinopolyspora alkaliphila]NED95735.1 DUF3500 domain-containing protein [Phytoactinopolyspora alkaliphila]
MANSASGNAAAGRMSAAARSLLDSLSPAQRAQAWAPFDVEDRREFMYVPGPRPGLGLWEMNADQQGHAMRLLATGLSERGLATAQAIMGLEEILAGIERAAGKGAWQRRDPGYYWFRVLGEPGGMDPWTWKVGGHHLAVHMTVVGDRIAGAPQFFGANPARVPDGHPKAGTRTLPEEEDLARALVADLTPGQWEVAVRPAPVPQDIITRDDPVADVGGIPSGLMYNDMGAGPRDTLARLIRCYLGRVVPDAADAAWAEIEAAGLDRVAFTWAGHTDPGNGHYYAVLGPTFLLEYDNTQNDANHVHTVWRDLRNDWGEDLLAMHYAAHRHRE